MTFFSGVVRTETDQVKQNTSINQAIQYLNTLQNCRIYLNSSQTGNAVNAFTKINFDTVDFDPFGIADVATNHRITPTVAGTYFVTVTCDNQTSVAYATTSAGASNVSKNGTRVQGQTLAVFNSGSNGECFCQTSCLVQCNGTTDFIEGLGGALAASGTVDFLASGKTGTTMSLFRVGP